MAKKIVVAVLVHRVLENKERLSVGEHTAVKHSLLSFFGKICKMKPTTSCASLVKEIRYPVFKGNAITLWGLQKEPIAIALFASERNVEVQSSGLIVDEKCPFLAASPDGLVGKTKIIEIKCPASARTMAIGSAVDAKKIKWSPTAERKSLSYVSSTGYFAYYCMTSMLLRLVSIWHGSANNRKGQFILERQNATKLKNFLLQMPSSRNY
ncbi:hypothetical protein PR048_013175 [Dryococelus australis]|uniref:YqaJ viral recombinase domain-containing protein n=1 Tax=Dryococelus australis TaxID=614101 RepID=A0ABQ9HRL0_9NEOP|nr:hypothetical protein PR048_013175 [Dryococelus australis]